MGYLWSKFIQSLPCVLTSLTRGCNPREKESALCGQVLIELLVAIGASVILVPAMFSGFAASREGGVQQTNRLIANSLAEGAIEAVRVVREADWENVAVNGLYHPDVSGNSWTLVAGQETIDNFNREVIVGSVFRDVNGNIVESGGTLDPSVKKVTARVTWQSFLPSEVLLTTYLARLTSEQYTETLQAEFEAGINEGTAVINTAGGEVQLGAGGHSNWCTPSLSIDALDLPRQGDALAVTAIEGSAFAGTGVDASGVSFAKIDITDTDPPRSSSPSNNWFNGYKTNDVFGDASYGYIATDSNSEEIVVINLTTTPYTKTGYFNAPGNTNANSVFILGNTGYMTQNNVLRNFDLTNCKQTPEADSCPAIDSDGAAISATGTAVYVVGTYAYVSIAGHVRELEIFDISNPANIVRRGYADVNGEAATDVFMNGDGSRAYIVTNASSSLPEFFIINTSNKTCNDCPDIGTYNAGTSVNLKGVEIVPGARAVVIGVGGEEYQVIDISNETLPIRCGGLQYNAGIYDSASVQEADNDAYTYFVTGDANAEFRIIEGGPGGAVSESGVFTSRVFDAGSDTAFNRFDATFSEPASSDIKFQVGAGDTVGGVCDASGLTFVGPDATSATFFENDGLIPLNDDGLAYENPARCFAYKVFFNSPYATPIFYDITVNYSP